MDAQTVLPRFSAYYIATGGNPLEPG
jgi:hypothetical protein